MHVTHGYPKAIPYTKFEHFDGIIRFLSFELCCGQTDKQTNTD